MDNVLDNFRVDEEKLIVNSAGDVPLIYWPLHPNFGDELSRWLVEAMTSRRVVMSRGDEPSYAAIGSIIDRVKAESEVWGTGSFGPERPRQINTRARYHAVRGPLTRSRIIDRGGKCPRVYGDPALLTPLYFPDEVEKSADIGIAVRWSDKKWKNLEVGEGVKLIDFGTTDVEGTLRELLSCRRIVTSSLHGLIIADAYGIPSAWLSSVSPTGYEFKYYDYFLSVEKVRHAQSVSLHKTQLTVAGLDSAFSYDDRPIVFDARELLEACPFLKRVPV